MDIVNTPAANYFAWYGIHVRSQSEKRVSDALIGKGYECLLPIYREKRKWSDRTKILELPLFPGYVFVRFDVQARLPILKTPHVLGIVGTGKVPQPVEDHEIAHIRTVAATGYPARPWPFLKVGQRVRITAGPLTGVEGILVRGGATRVALSVTLISRSIVVQVDVDAVAFRTGNI